MNRPSVPRLKSNYALEVSKILKSPKRKNGYTVLDMYAGAGGLSLGLEAAGFAVTGIEQDIDCCATYNHNLKGKCSNYTITPKSNFPEADIVVGGPPCQPFSVRGKQRGSADARNGIPAFINAVRVLRPEIWMFENVRGILYKNNLYFKSSMRKLERLGYRVHVSVANCRDYGVPQSRERVIAVGCRHKTYQPAEKIGVEVTAGDALRNMPRTNREKPLYLTPTMDKYIRKYEVASQCQRPRDLDMTRPARTVTCRNLGGYTSDMHRVQMRNGRRRLLFVREAARLQGFPDWFEFNGAWNKKMSQIGNAVPPLFALVLGMQIDKCLK